MSQGMQDGDEGILVNSTGALFQFLKTLTPLALLNATAFKGRSRSFRSALVDSWIILNFGLALAAAILAALNVTLLSWLPAAVGIYAAYRLYDILIVQVNVLVFDPYFHQRKFLRGEVDQPYSLRGRYRLLIAVLMNFFEIGLWYSAAYLHLRQIGELVIAGVDADGIVSLPIVFQQCMRALVTFDISVFSAHQGSLSLTLIVLQSFIGMFMTVVMLARIISLLPPPNADSDPKQQ